jgi:phytoene dehydrogenase-like protein
VAREFDDQKQSILAALDATSAAAETGDPFFRSALPLPPEGFFDRRAIRRALRECPAMCCGDEQLRAIEGHPFAEALEALAGFVTHLRNDGRSTPAQRRPLGQILRGAYRFPGGSIGLRDTLRSRLTELGGAWIGEGTGPAKIEELLFERGRFAGVRLASSGNVFRASCLVAATDVSTLAPLLPPAMKKRRMTQLLGSVRASRSLLSVNLVVRADGLPLGLGELALIVPGDEQAGPILLEVLKAQKAGHEVSEERVLCAAALISVADSQAGEGRLRELAGRIEAAVLELAPFVDPHLIARSVPALDAGGAAGRRSASPALIEVGNDRLLGIAGLPHRTPCRNLLLSSSEVLPGLGLEGELVSGARAADLVQEALRKHDPLK